MKESEKEYFNRMAKIAESFMKEHNLEIGKTYKGIYFCSDKIYIGKLTQIDAADDGVFAYLKLDNGEEQGDIDAYSLSKIDEPIKPRKYKTLSETYPH